MINYVEEMFLAMRPAFSRKATFIWFVIVFAGCVTRTDTYGVSSIIRALCLSPVYYPCLLHFFHSSAWSTQSILNQWWLWLVHQKAAYMVGERVVFFGDHTKKVKDGRKMPEVTTLHQDSETSSKPSFFRGHHWGCISLLINAGKKFWSIPLWAEIHRDALQEKRSTRIVTSALEITHTMHYQGILVLDAFFSVGTVFEKVLTLKEECLHILTRAKKNIVAYRPPPQEQQPKVGRPTIYGEKLKLMNLFDSYSNQFKTMDAHVYEKVETIRYLVLDLIWKPVKTQLRFILLESSRGKIILITSDLLMQPQTAIFLYCKRVSIETLFDSLKNLLGGMCYHFWSKYLKPASRRPTKKKNTPKQISLKPEKTANTLAAIEKFVLVQMIVLGTLQLLACKFSKQVTDKANCWLRTTGGKIPSVFVTKTALANCIRINLIGFAKDWITQLILKKQSNQINNIYLKKVA